MPLVPNFTAAQNVAIPNIIVLTDSSASSDVAITQRRVILTKSDGTTLVPSGTATTYISWPIASSSISIDALDKDYSLSITVQWLDVSNAVLYTKTILFVFTAHLEQFYYNLTQLQTSNPEIVNDKSYYDNKMKLRVEIDSANQAISNGADISSAQFALNRAKILTDNENIFF